jgi:hypothetical protein
MLKGFSAALTVAGITLIVWGLRAYRSFASEVTEAVTGAPSDKAIWLLVSGTVAALVGLFGLFTRSRGS